MARINLGGGKWFDPQRAQQWSEKTRWNGSNHISVPTGSQWEHEELYRSRSGAWILHEWSQWQGAGESYRTIGADTARQWLIDNDHDVDEAFPGALAASEI